MGKKNDVPLKEIYRLRWEYFKRSGLYNRFGEKFLSIMAEKEEIRWRKLVAARDEEKRNDKNFSLLSFLLFQELMEGKSIDEWWETNEMLTKARNPRAVDISKNMQEFKEFYFDFSIGILPKNAEVGKGFFDVSEERPIGPWDWGKKLLQPLYGDLIISISGLLFWKNKQLEKEIRKLIRSRKKEIKDFEALSGKLRYNKVYHYLDVYDRVESLKKKKLSWKKITHDFYPQLAKKLKEKNMEFTVEGQEILNRLDSHKRLLQMENKKANEIINNTEKGQFPGKY